MYYYELRTNFVNDLHFRKLYFVNQYLHTKLRNCFFILNRFQNVFKLYFYVVTNEYY